MEPTSNAAALAILEAWRKLLRRLEDDEALDATLRRNARAAQAALEKVEAERDSHSQYAIAKNKQKLELESAFKSLTGDSIYNYPTPTPPHAAPA